MVSLSLRRAWIEIQAASWKLREELGRSPYGERGLKWLRPCGIGGVAPSLSLRRAWIEIKRAIPFTQKGKVALLTESVD